MKLLCKISNFLLKKRGLFLPPLQSQRDFRHQACFKFLFGTIKLEIFSMLLHPPLQMGACWDRRDDDVNLSFLLTMSAILLSLSR